MPGVWSGVQHLYEAYSGLTWPGKLVRYDYTKNTVADLVQTLLLMMKDQ
jgi:hypothetical protein